jgi:4-hydroxybenzoyl-CoA thioesterase
MAFTYSIPVRFADCDFAKIVYYPRYLHFCHVTMEEFFAQVVGLPYHEALLRENVGYPTVRVDAEYRAPIPMGETVEMSVVVERLGRKSVDFRYEGRRSSDGALAFVCRSRSVAVNMRDWHSVGIPAHHRESFTTILEKPADPADPAHSDA